MRRRRSRRSKLRRIIREEVNRALLNEEVRSRTLLRWDAGFHGSGELVEFTGSVEGPFDIGFKHDRLKMPIGLTDSGARLVKRALNAVYNGRKDRVRVEQQVGEAIGEDENFPVFLDVAEKYDSIEYGYIAMSTPGVLISTANASKFSITLPNEKVEELLRLL